MPFQFRTKQKFYDIVDPNTETYEVDNDHDKICELYFRLNSYKLNHVRIVFSFYEWISLIGSGLYVIKSFFMYVLGDLLYFNC